MEDAGLEFLLDAVDRFPLREEFTDSLEHPDPVPLVVLSRRDAPLLRRGIQTLVLGADDMSEAKSRGSRGATHSGDCSLLQQGLLNRHRVNPEAPGWHESWLHLGSAPADRTPCLSRMSALEQLIRKYAEEPTKIVVQPELGLGFDSLEEAYDLQWRRDRT